MDFTNYARNRQCLWMCSTMEWYWGFIFILTLLLRSEGAGRFGKKLSRFLDYSCGSGVSPFWSYPARLLQTNRLGWAGYHFFFFFFLTGTMDRYTWLVLSMILTRIGVLVANTCLFRESDWMSHAASFVVMAWFIDFLCKLLPENCQMTKTV